MIPTIGFLCEEVQYKNIRFTTWDAGGGDKIRLFWRKYYEEKDAWIADGKPEPNDCTYSCMCMNGGIESCDPYSQIAMKPDKAGSMLCLLGIYGICYLLSWFILSRLSNKYE